MVSNPGSGRISHSIKQGSIARVLNAVNFAASKGLPLNTCITINFWQTCCPKGQESAVFAKLRDGRFTPFIRRAQKKIASPGVPPTYVWTLENSCGVHAHWLLHVPAHRIELLRQKLPQWLNDITGGNFDDASLHIQDAPNPVGLAKYILKGADAFWAATYNIRPEEQGPIVGKRAGTSENIGKAARQQAVQRGEVLALGRINRKRPIVAGSRTATPPPSVMRA